MFRKLCYLAFVLLLFVNCKSETSSKKVLTLSPELDSIERVHNQSILDSGERITRAYVDSENNRIDLWADIKLDHRFYGYEKPDANSKRLILFSIFTNDVDGNPFGLDLGAYYSTADVEGGIFTFVSEKDDFVEAEFQDKEGKKTTLYFERKWIVLSDDDIVTNDDYNPEEDDETIKEYGLIVKFEDGAYPMYIVTVEFPERRGMIMDFNLNIEAVNINGETLNNLPGKYVTLYYTSELVDDLNDIHFEGKSLYGQYAPEMDDSWNQFTGTLSGAKSLSGDLPNLIGVTDSLGETRNFELYVDDVVQKAEGKQVTVFHSIRSINTITYIEPSKD
jgi:hypothetical protein